MGSMILTTTCIPTLGGYAAASFFAELKDPWSKPPTSASLVGSYCERRKVLIISAAISQEFMAESIVPPFLRLGAAICRSLIGRHVGRSRALGY